MTNAEQAPAAVPPAHPGTGRERPAGPPPSRGAAAAAGSPAPRPRFGPYEIDRLIGRGGTGEVHRAHDTRRDRVVALKRISPRLLMSAAMRERFEREAALAARLNEPHVIPVHDFGEIDGRLYIDMRLVDGVDLAAALRRHRVTPQRAADIVGQVADALDAAHRQDLVHRDVKPSNVLLAGRDETGAVERGFVYLTDFGTATLLDPGDAGPDTTVSGTGPTTGTLVYTAPERFSSARGDQRADVYSLACLLWELLTGSPPFPHDDVPGMLRAKFHPPPGLRVGLPAGLDAVLARGLAVDPRDRFGSAGELAAAAARVLTASAGVPTTVSLPEPGSPPADANDGRGAPAALQADGTTTVHPGRRSRRWLAPAGTAALGALVAAALALAALVVLPRLLERPPPGFVPVDRVTVGALPAEVALALDGTRAYVSNRGDDTVSVIDLTTLRPVGAPIRVADGPNSVALTRDGRWLLVTSPAADSLTVIDTRTSEAKVVPVPGYPDGLAVAPDGSEAYVVSATTGTVTVVDAATWTVREPPIAVGLVPYGAAVAPDGDRLYVTNSQSDDVAVVDIRTRTVVKFVPVGDEPNGIAVTPNGRRVLVANMEGGTVEQIDTVTNTVVGTPLPVGDGPLGIEADRDGERALVTTRDADSLVVVSLTTGQVEWRGEGGWFPVDLAADPRSGLVYVVREGSGELGVFAPTPS